MHPPMADARVCMEYTAICVYLTTAHKKLLPLSLALPVAPPHSWPWVVICVFAATSYLCKFRYVTLTKHWTGRETTATQTPGTRTAVLVLYLPKRGRTRRCSRTTSCIHVCQPCCTLGRRPLQSLTDFFSGTSCGPVLEGGPCGKTYTTVHHIELI